MTFEIYVLGALALIIVILFIWVIWLQNKLGKLLVGKSKNLDQSFSELNKEIKELRKFQIEAEETFKSHDQRLRKSLTALKTIRFNPFKGEGIGGNQSFATAFLNEENDGLIISSMYSRDRVSVFAKPIKDLKSEYELTGEEKKVLDQAEESINK